MSPNDPEQAHRGLPQVAMAWLPRDEYDDWPTRWPDLADSKLVVDGQGGSVTHAVYCQRIERELRELHDAGAARVRIAPIRAAAARQWVAEHESEDLEPAALRARMAAELGARDPSLTIPWPPGRNDPCWCGSGRKYKKCCAAPGAEERS